HEGRQKAPSEVALFRPVASRRATCDNSPSPRPSPPGPTPFPERTVPMLCLRAVLPAACVVALLLAWPLAASAADDVSARAKKFLDAHTKKLRPLEVEAALAWWNANISGKDEDYKKKIETQNKIDEALSDRDAFAEVKALKDDANDIKDTTLRRA